MSDLFNWKPDAAGVRDAAIDQVGEHADQDQIERAREDALATARSRHDFTTDDITTAVHFREPRAWGAVMRSLARDGLIVPTPEYRQSKSAACHARPKRVWKEKR